MKARVKVTGEIIEVTRDNRCSDFDYLDVNSRILYKAEALEFIEGDPDYWARLEHQYAGMVMQGILSNPHIALKDIKVDTVTDVYVDNIIKIAHALAEKYKKEERE